MDQCSHRTEIRQLISRANQLTGVFMMRTSAVKELKLLTDFAKNFVTDYSQGPKYNSGATKIAKFGEK